MYLGSDWSLPIATMHTWGGRIKGQAWVPPIVPMLDRQIVPPWSSFAVSLAPAARFLSLSSSACMPKRLRLLTLLTWGTTRPLGESIAMLMLWLEWILY